MREKSVTRKSLIVLPLVLAFILYKCVAGTDITGEVESFGLYGAIEIGILVTIAAIKGVLLGFKKVVTQYDNGYTMRSSRAYVLIWVLLFAISISVEILFRVEFHAGHPSWLTMADLFIYQTIMRIVVVVRHPGILAE
jgi:hypothetical protein